MILNLALCSGTMAFVWWIALRQNFLSLVDAVWAFGISACAMIQCSLGNAPLFRKFLFASLALLWGGRLGLHLSKRLAHHYPQEDARYTQLKTEWGPRTPSKSFWFFQLQALSQVLLSYPFLVGAFDPSTALHWNEAAGAGLVTLGLLGEALSDRQLRRFKADSANRGRVCQVGFWHLSRHPNYFFEWITWCGFGLLAVAAPGGLLALLCPVAILLLVLFVTGIPPAEASSLKSRGAEYVRYQMTTSKFVPWLPKKWLQKGDEYVG